ncbi:MAG: glycosyltransferase family 2 protein [Bacilli bacterium]|nr:glycosyltransferase family 2 protein [Bacilli bacterium]MDD4055856.1 glycosyltransferase family 2 protein [Bacteroides sp.]
MKEQLLTIAIPTYNRAELLNYVLANLIDTISDFNLEIIICDNASTDNTADVVRKFKLKYENIFYFCQKSNIGFDRNLLNCYKNSRSEYIWVMSDYYAVEVLQLKKILYQLKKGDLDGIVINESNRVNNINSKMYNDISVLISELGWHMSLLGSCIIKKKLIENVTYERYLNTGFIHFGCFFESLALIDDLRIYWIHENSITNIKKKVLEARNIKKGTWFNRLFELFATKWFCTVMSLPHQIDINSKLKCVRDHDRNTHIFSIRSILGNIVNNTLSVDDYRNNKIFLRYVTEVEIWKINLIFFAPTFLYRFISSIKTLTKNILNG